ncbi:hypothetical protein MCOR20_003422 [Pyricularia oryzae]|uniref:Uncharacterized protein n=1 Tax=Pyricularia grisea TaxID=148305 RepID=A0ABQ8NZE2_PYRGI|nr:hypothetical protein MCOR33_000886 [Pyricularia grisea]KAI6412637.1 hypothetical protein MCOR20_003422 [Pyricularia oryzae]KAI6462950.1 hypothetical protein MCOR15_004356 [Pyricularia oryzae]KAI6531507.1 hypothetical protein MCOR05_007352 [Pyricularia oryzae]KAI6541124.1 hypothetical protein MCOR16_000672 [Pyricularia oryzae]
MIRLLVASLILAFSLSPSLGMTVRTAFRSPAHEAVKMLASRQSDCDGFVPPGFCAPHLGDDDCEFCCSDFPGSVCHTHAGEIETCGIDGIVYHCDGHL